MRIPLDSRGKIKAALYGGIGFLLTLAWILTIGVFSRDGSTHAATGWYFALCWLSMPVLVYLIMVPMWTRTLRFANVYIIASLDAVSVILWLSAWAAVAAYIAAGKSAGMQHNAGGCDNFGYGSPGKCKLSEAATVIGVFIMLLFAVTSYYSMLAVRDYRMTGMGPSEAAAAAASDFDIQSQEAFASQMSHNEAVQGSLRYHESGHYQPAPQHSNECHVQRYPADRQHLDYLYPVQPAGPLQNPPSTLDMRSYDTSYGSSYGNHASAVPPQMGLYESSIISYGRRHPNDH